MDYEAEYREFLRSKVEKLPQMVLDLERDLLLHTLETQVVWRRHQVEVAARDFGVDQIFRPTPIAGFYDWAGCGFEAGAQMTWPEVVSWLRREGLSEAKIIEIAKDLATLGEFHGDRIWIVFGREADGSYGFPTGPWPIVRSSGPSWWIKPDLDPEDVSAEELDGWFYPAVPPLTI